MLPPLKMYLIESWIPESIILDSRYLDKSIIHCSKFDILSLYFGFKTLKD